MWGKVSEQKDRWSHNYAVVNGTWQQKSDVQIWATPRQELSWEYLAHARFTPQLARDTEAPIRQGLSGTAR